MSVYFKIVPPYKLISYIFLKDYRTILGLVILLFGQIISFSDVSHFDTAAVKLNFSETTEVKGKIVAINPIYYALTNNYLYGYDYEFNHPTYGLIFGASYGKNHTLNIGDQIIVEYLKDEPGTHRIKGYKNSFFIDISLIYFLVTLLGFLFIAYGIKFTNQFVKVVKFGYITTAKLDEKPTSHIIEETRYYVMKFSFFTKEGACIRITKELSNPNNILDDEEELIVYDVNMPSKNYFVDRLPPKLKAYIYQEIRKEKESK